MEAPWWRGNLDVVAALAAALLAAVAALSLPEGSTARMAITLPVLFIVPGYVALQAVFLPKRDARRRWFHALFSIGLSPAIVGLLALTTALAPGGFQPRSIVLLLTLAILWGGALGIWRRRTAGRPTGRPNAWHGRQRRGSVVRMHRGRYNASRPEHRMPTHEKAEPDAEKRAPNSQW
jgi:uncharacterized membrane protein